MLSIQSYIFAFALFVCSSSAQQFGYVYIQESGNRYAMGLGSFGSSEPVSIQFDSRVEWVTALFSLSTNQLIVAVVMSGGQTGLARIDVESLQVSYEDIAPSNIGDRVPVLYYDDTTDSAQILVDMMGSALSGVVPLNENASVLASISSEGDLIVIDTLKSTRETVDLGGLKALDDARIILAGDRKIVLVLEPTNRYFHGILGDESEGSSLAIITLDESYTSTPTDVTFMTDPSPKVHEQLNAIYNQQTIYSTLADISEGAQLVSYSADTGELLRTGPTIGQGFRWRNQMAVAPTAPNGAMEIIDVLTPHIGGTVEFFQPSFELDSKLELVAKSRPIYTSHVIGSRNTDMGFVGDVDGDGKLEVLVPTLNLVSLVALQREAQGVEEKVVFEFEGDQLSSNLIGVEYNNESMAVVAGLDSGRVLVWV